MIKEGIQKLIDRTNLPFEEAQGVMREVMSGKATNGQIAAFLATLRMKGETVEELIAFAAVMREHCRRIHPRVQSRLVDTCGTGGGAVTTFNISTAAALVAAGAGVRVAKHGNRSFTSRSGSADVLEALGVKIQMSPEEMGRVLDEANIVFMFAPLLHPAMKRVASSRPGAAAAPPW